MKTFVDDVADEREARGEAIGEARGEARNAVRNILSWLNDDYGPESSDLQSKIKTIVKIPVLDDIFRLMRRARSLEQIRRGVDELLKADPDATVPIY